MTQPPILTLTLNPALDLAAEVARVVAGPKLRLGTPRVDPGGGGINVARAVGRIGGQALALVALGGATGARLSDLLTAEGIGHLVLPVPGETRESLTVTETESGAEYRFVMPGPAMTEADGAAILSAVAAAVRGALADAASGVVHVVLSGSQPPGLGDDFPLRLARALPPGAALTVDTSGAPLAALTRDRGDVAPVVLRMDSEEAETLMGRALPTPSATADAAQDLVARGVAGMVIMARGAEGSVLAAPGLRLWVRPPAVPVVSKVGAGDSFAAGFVLGLARGDGPAQALRLGVAAAAAAVMTPGTDLCRGADVARLLPQTVLSEV
jgi:6-phosphofructokinase 2